MKFFDAITRSKLLVFVAFLNTILSAQSQELKPDQDVILKAMQDELNHNMKELHLPKYEKPFFMMYGVLDQKSYTISAVLGSLQQSIESSDRFKINTRILVGDYSFNDESLEDNLSSQPTAIEIGLPLDSDYFGIRRAFWSTTDEVYRDAAKHFEKHKETLKETGKTLADIPHRWFASAEPVQLLSTLPKYVFDKAQVETLAKRLSAKFINYPTILYSAVVIQYVEGHKYLVSSEGTVAKVPFCQTSLIIVGQSKSKDGEFAVEQRSHNTNKISELPSEQQLSVEIDDMIVRLARQFDLPKFKDEYTGPVMFTNKAVAELFSNALFKGRENIYARDNIAKLKGLQYDQEFGSMESKIGKNIVNESVTVIVKPKLKSYNGTDLLGSFDIDDEGVVPADELVVVDKGILKNLLNNRTLTSTTQKSNGFSGGPGVVEVTIAKRNSEKELKDKLIAQAKKEGLDYGMLVRDAPGLGIGVLNVYKVSVSDGKEELVRDALLETASLKTLKRILGASEKHVAYNIGSARGFDRRPDGGMVSLIVPDAVLVEEMEIKPFRMPSLKEEEYVSSPLEKKK